MTIDITQKLTELGFIVKSIKENRVNRCATIDKPNKKNGWFRVFAESVSYGSWDDTIQSGYFWTKELTTLTQEEKIVFAKKRAQREIKQRELEEIERSERLLSVNKAYALTKQTKRSHPYQIRKQIDFRNDFTFDLQDRLVIPVININNQLVGYQYIDDNGVKMFKSGSLMKGGFYPFIPYGLKLQDLDVLFVCEGVATAASIYQALNLRFSFSYGVIACFSANNVDVVVSDIYLEIGRKSIVAIKDNDVAGLNVKTSGFAVSDKIGGDANDVYCEQSASALADIILAELNKPTPTSDFKGLANRERELLSIAIPNGLTHLLPLEIFTKANQQVIKYVLDFNSVKCSYEQALAMVKPYFDCVAINDAENVLMQKLNNFKERGQC